MKSPTIKKEKKKELNFSEAITEILTGKSVTKLEWNDKKYHALLVAGRLMLHKPDGQCYEWVLSEADLRGDDYVCL
jgi:hypothetical protein